MVAAVLTALLLVTLSQSPTLPPPPAATASSARFWLAPVLIGGVVLVGAAASFGLAFGAHDTLTTTTFTTKLSVHEADQLANLMAFSYPLAWVCVGAGAALVAVGVALGLWPREGVGVGATVTPGGAAFTWSQKW